MTVPDAADHLEDIDAMPRIVLDDDGLDTLELALGGALPGLPALAGIPAGMEVVLTDAQNTPLARIRLTGDPRTSTVHALRPLASGTGPHWDPALRRPAADVRSELRRTVGERPALAVVVDDPPTYADVRALVEAAGRGDHAAVLCVVPVARRRRPPGEVGWAGLTRIGQALARTLAESRPKVPVTTVVLPWPGLAEGSGGADHDLDEVLAAYGAAGTFSIRASRDAQEHERVRSLPRLFEVEVRELYPQASADEVLRASALSVAPRGAVVFFTGLSGSGKSTIARALADDLEDRGSRQVTLLDGDEVRQLLSADLGFDAASREMNIERIAYVASIVAAHGGIAIAAPIAPFATGRRRARSLAQAHGAFLLIHVNTPLEVCEARDRKGLYARARAGLVADFTGISSPYEEPDDADVVIDTTNTSVPEAIKLIREALEGALAGDSAPAG